MLLNRSMQILGQITTKANKIARNSQLIPRQNQQLRSQCQNQRQNQHQQPQQIQHESNHYYRAPLAFQTPIKSNLNKNYLKGSVCLVLLPVSTVSHISTVKVSIGQSASFSSSSRTSKSDNQAQTIESTDMASEDYKNANSIYDFTVKDTHGNDVSLEKYKGHVILIVNIASQCGLTKNNYKKLTDLKAKYHDQGLRILNFPCNQFGSQMPESDGEPMVCHLRDAKADIGDVFQKLDVNGSGTAPLYQYLKAKQGGTLGSAIKWNFTKFLVNKEGIPVNRYAPTTDPMDIAKDIEKLL